MTSPRSLPDGVQLRLVQPGDGASIADAVVRNREHLRPTDPARDDSYFTADWHEAEIPKQVAAYSAGTALPLLLVNGSLVIGRVNLTSIVRGPLQSAVLGYWIDADYAGRGLVSAAVAEVIAIARDDLGLHRLEAGTLEHNLASQRVLQKAGFEQFGMAPNYLLIDGRWQNHRLFQIILHD